MGERAIRCAGLRPAARSGDESGKMSRIDNTNDSFSRIHRQTTARSAVSESRVSPNFSFTPFLL